MRTALLLLLVIAGTASAEPPKASPKAHAPPRSGYISVLFHSPDEVDALHMSCSPEDPVSPSLSPLECEFNHLLVTKKESTTSEGKEALAQELRERLSAPGGLKKALGQCRESAAYLDDVYKRTTNPHKRASVERERDAVNAFCACKTVDCAVAARVDELGADKNACNITHTHFERKFTQQAPKQWVSVSGPNGICQIVLTLIVEYNEGDDAWTYTQKRVVTSQNEKCQGFESTQRSYSHHRYYRDAIMHCETIDTLLP